MEKLTENMIRFEERNKMIIQDFEPKHIEEAMGIALSAYNYERRQWALLLVHITMSGRLPGIFL